MEIFVHTLESILFLIVSEETTAIRDGPQPVFAVFQALCGIIDDKVALSRIVIFDVEALGMIDVALYADDTLVFCGSPYIACMVFYDVSYIYSLQKTMAFA